MDGDYFWVIILVLYLVFQVLGGRKKKKQTRRPGATGPQRSDAPAKRSPETLREARTRDGELDDALQEIRRALGFPDADPPPHEPKPGGEMPAEASSETIPQPERRSIYSEPVHQPPPSIPQHHQERPTPVSQPAAFPDPVTSAPDIGGSGMESQPDQQRITRRLRKPPPSLKSGQAIREIQEIPPAKKGSAEIRKRLSNPQSFREAFLIKEILDLPRSRRPMR